MDTIDNPIHISVKYNKSYLLKVIWKFSLHLKPNPDRNIK